MEEFVRRSKWRGVRPHTRHSIVLSVAGLVYIGTGLLYIYTEPNAARVQALKVALHMMPMQGWGVVFIIAGLLALVSSRWPPASETWGYTSMTGLSAGWAGVYLSGIAVGGAPSQNLTGALVWGLVAFLWWAVSGLVNPATITRK